MSKRIMAALLAASIMCSLTACDFLNKAKPTEITTTAEETTTEATTTVEETTTEETTAEETTAEETTASVETSTTEESISETTTAAPTKKPTKKPTPKPKKKVATAPKVPKGYFKDIWGKKYKGRKVYIVRDSSASVYKGWSNGKWIRLYVTSKMIKSYYQWCYYTDSSHKNLFYKYNNYDY